MKPGHCKDNCRKYDQCQTPHNCYVAHELKRLEKGRKKQIELVSESEMTGPQSAFWANTIYGAYSDAKDG